MSEEKNTPAASGIIAKTFSRLFLNQAKIVSNTKLSERFHLIKLQGDDLKKASWRPGHKLQINIATFTSRTYTPLYWDTGKGEASASLLPSQSGESG